MPAILSLVTGSAIEVHGYCALFAPGGPERFQPNCFMLDSGLPLVINHYGHEPFAISDDGSMRLWQDRIGLAFAATVTTEKSGSALLAYLGRGVGCSIAWGGATRIHGAISSCTLRDIAVTDHPWDPRSCAWRNDTNYRDLLPAARALHSDFYAARDIRNLVDLRAHKLSTAVTGAPRPLARRPAVESGPAAAADRSSDARVDILRICDEINARHRTRA